MTKDRKELAIKIISGSYAYQENQIKYDVLNKGGNFQIIVVPECDQSIFSCFLDTICALQAMDFNCLIRAEKDVPIFKII